MDRRIFLAVIGSTLAAPLAAEAQSTEKVHTIDMLEPVSAAANAPTSRAFRQSLGELGTVRRAQEA